MNTKPFRFILFVLALSLLIQNCREAYLQSINFYISQRDWEKARAELQKLFEKEPENAELHFFYGDVLAHLNDYQGMHEHFQRSQSLSSKYHYKINYLTQKYRVENYNAGVLLGRQKDYLAAIERFTYAMIIDPKNPDAYIQMAHIYLDQENYEQAIDFYQKAIMLNRKDIVSRNNLASIYLKQNDLQKTIEVCKEILKIDNKHTDSVQGLAYCYDVLNDYPNAVKWYKRGINLCPDEKKLYTNLGIIHFKLKEFDQAVVQFQHALNLDSTSIKINTFLGDSYRQLYDYKNMITCFNRLVDLDPTNKDAWKNLIMAYQNLGLVEKADEAVSKLEQVP
jgi:tetratricopeptide (TPR) repeat protein